MRSKADQRGFSLIEALVSMLLGCFLLLAAVSVFLSSRKVMETSDGLTTVLDSSRAAFQIMGRDLREAGGNPCSSSLIYASTLNNSGAAWWTQVAAGIQGHGANESTPGTPFGTTAASRLAGTDALDLHTALSAESPEARVVGAMSSATSPLSVSSGAGFAVGDVALACDPLVGYLFQITQVGSTTLGHAQGGAMPGNCSGEFPPPGSPCSSAGAGYRFEPNAMVSGLASVRWYVGPNDRGGTSLFRATLSNPAGAGTPSSIAPTEVAADVDGMTLTYQMAGSSSYVPAASVADWRMVRAVRIQLELVSRPGAQTEGEAVRRNVSQVVAIRNRSQ